MNRFPPARHGDWTGLFVNGIDYNRHEQREHGGTDTPS